MQLTTKTRYGVRALFDIAFYCGGDRAAQAKEIARREDIPLRYLEQIFQDLKRAGLVESKRGPRGGYFLRREPSDISLGEIVRALQGPIEDDIAAPTEAAGPTCPKSLMCTLWQELADHVGSWLDGITLAELIQRGEALGLGREGKNQPMYYI